MSESEIAAALVLLGVLFALRFEVFAVLLASMLVVVGLIMHGVTVGDGTLAIALKTVCGVILFQVAYLFGGMLLSLTRRLIARLRGDAHVLPRGKDR